MSNFAGAVIEGYRRWERKPADMYPTPAEVTQALLFALMAESLTVRDRRLATIWEPACGEGHISEVCRANGYEVISTDIRHTGYGEGGIDFLTFDAQADLIITNPPFSLAEAFIRKAVRSAPVVAMLLKSSYWHAASRADLFKAHKPYKVYALTWRPVFLPAERGNSPLMDCIWCVWARGATNTPEYELLSKPASVIELPTARMRLARLEASLTALAEAAAT